MPVSLHGGESSLPRSWAVELPQQVDHYPGPSSVHYGLIHIGFNMLLLYLLGLMLEPALGRTRFVALYFAALLTGSFGALLLSPHVFSGGASGAVFGLFGAAAAGLRQRGVSVMQTGIGG